MAISITNSTRVGVLMGGLSPEHDISIKSGKSVLNALLSRGYNAVAIIVDRELPFVLREQQIEVAWLALHGEYGEDGCVQGLLEVMGIPYTGSGVLGCAVSMDKLATKQALQNTDVLLIPDQRWTPDTPRPLFQSAVVVKDPVGGSSIGIWVCDSAEEFELALTEFSQHCPERTALIEKCIKGEEITVPVLDGVALPTISIRPRNEFFDLEAKYTSGMTEYIVPSPLAEKVLLSAQHQAVVAYQHLSMRGIARADFIVDENGRAYFLEINAIPGMTATSLAPMAAKHKGQSFEQLVEHILLSAQCRG